MRINDKKTEIIIDKFRHTLYYIKVQIYDPLAQQAEHLTFNQGVRRSNRRWITNLERYRSGHNEAVLKTVWVKARVGSNPTLSA